MQHKFAVSRGAQAEERPAKSCGKKIAYQLAGRAMWSRQPGEHRIRLQRAMLDQQEGLVQRATRSVVHFVPGRKRGDDHAGVGCSQRRTRSRVSRTCSAVIGGSLESATATNPL